MRGWIGIAVASLLACASGESEPSPAPPVAPIAQPAAEPEREPEPQAHAEPEARAEAQTETPAETTEAEPTPDPDPPAPTKTTGRRSKTTRAATSHRDSAFCRDARRRAMTETVCDHEGNCDSPGVPPPCR